MQITQMPLDLTGRDRENVQELYTRITTQASPMSNTVRCAQGKSRAMSSLARGGRGLLLATLLVVAAPDPVHAVGSGKAPWVGSTFGGAPCSGTNPSNFGPYDYTIHKDKLSVVELAHFNSNVENLFAGQNAAGPTTDIDYTLRVIPNHHRALNSAMQFHLQLEEYSQKHHKGKTGYKLRSPVECYMQRAVNYSPNDAISRMLFASFLHRKGHYDVADSQYKAARSLDPGNANIEYNYGLLLVDMERYGEARAVAKRLYAHNFPLPGLQNRLKAVGQW